MGDTPQNHGLSALVQAIDSSPLVQHVKEAIKSFDDMINGAIYAVGDKFGNALNALKEVKGPMLALGGSSLGGDPSSLPPITPSVTPDPSLGNSKGMVRSGPEITPKIAMDVNDVKMGISKGGEIAKAVHVQDGTEVCPMCTPNMNFGKGQGIGGRV